MIQVENLSGLVEGLKAIDHFRLIDFEDISRRGDGPEIVA